MGDEPPRRDSPAPEDEQLQLPPPQPPVRVQGWPQPVWPLRNRIDPVTIFTFASMLIGAGGILFIAWASRDVEDAFINYGNAFWWLVVGGGLLLLIDFILRLANPGFISPALSLWLSITLLAFGVGGLVDGRLIVPVFLSGLALALPLRIWNGRNDAVSAVTAFLLCVGAALLFFFAWINSDVRGALLHYGNLLAWLVAWAGLVLILDFILRLLAQGVFRAALRVNFEADSGPSSQTGAQEGVSRTRSRVSPIFSLLLSVALLALSIANLIDIRLSIPVLLFGTAVLASLVIWKSRSAMVPTFTSFLFFSVAGVLFFIAWVNKDSPDARITYDNLDLVLGFWIEFVLMLDIALGVLLFGNFRLVTPRLALFVLIAAAGAGIKIDRLLFLPVLLAGAGATLLVWRATGALERLWARFSGRSPAETPSPSAASEL